MVGGCGGLDRVLAGPPARQDAKVGWRLKEREVSRISCILCQSRDLWLWQAAPRGQFQQVVDGADQRPFALHRGQAAPQELAEAARLFDLSEDRFHNALSRRIDRCPNFGL